MKCAHKTLDIHTEKDRCSWVQCAYCGAKAPKKHSVTLALCAWIIYASNDHPKRRKRAQSNR
jgi:hypothetical protein